MKKPGSVLIILFLLWILAQGCGIFEKGAWDPTPPKNPGNDDTSKTK